MSRTETTVGGLSPSSGTVSDGSTDAPEIPEQSPTGNGRIIAVIRPVDDVRVGGIVVQIAGVGDGTDSTVRGQLRVMAGEVYEDLVSVSDSLLVCDHAAGYLPALGTVLRLGSAPAGTVVPAGTRLALMWFEVGDLNPDPFEPDPPASRPTFRLLGWPLITAVPASF